MMDSLIASAILAGAVTTFLYLSAATWKLFFEWVNQSPSKR